MRFLAFPVLAGILAACSGDAIFRLDSGSGEVLDQVDLVGFGPIPAAGNLWTVDFLSNTVYRLDEAAS